MAPSSQGSHLDAEDGAFAAAAGCIISFVDMILIRLQNSIASSIATSASSETVVLPRQAHSSE